MVGCKIITLVNASWLLVVNWTPSEKADRFLKDMNLEYRQ